MYSQQQSSRQAPGIFSYMELFSSKLLAYSLFFGVPFATAIFSTIFNAILFNNWNLTSNFWHFIEIFIIFMAISGGSVLFTLIFYSRKAPILGPPPKGWTIQLNSFFCAIIAGSFLIGNVITVLLKNQAFQEIFFIMGTILSYIIAFTIYFSFTTVGRPGYLYCALVQPVIGIVLYSLWTAQFSLDFFIKAIIFFCSCAFIYALPYAFNMFHVSNIYRAAAGVGGYGFIRAFVLSMLTDGNDEKIEEFFEKTGINSTAKLQYLLIRNIESKKLKSIFFIPHIHFGPFKTCGSSDLPEHIYKTFNDIPGTTVYHTTTDHAQNLTSQKEVDKILNKIKLDIEEIKNNPKIKWIREIRDVTRKISNSAKIIGTEIGDVPIIFLTRHPLPSDDIEEKIGQEIRTIAKTNGYRDIIIIDSHNSIIGDEIHIKKDSIEANDLINVSKNFIRARKESTENPSLMLYGVAKDPLKSFSEKDGIGYGGMVVHIFQNSITKQKTAFIHFDGNNAYLDVRSFILNQLQNRGVIMGEVTTSDSHTVARQFTSRGYSPIGDKIKIPYILDKLEILIKKAEQNLEPVEFLYHESQENVRIWGNMRYFDAIMDTLQECIRKSQRMLSLTLIIPTFFSLVLLLFYYNIKIGEII
ncbi:MAG: DUF2070 family protein [Promethearchaeota archaeon]